MQTIGQQQQLIQVNPELHYLFSLSLFFFLSLTLFSELRCAQNKSTKHNDMIHQQIILCLCYLPPGLQLNDTGSSTSLKSDTFGMPSNSFAFVHFLAVSAMAALTQRTISNDWKKEEDEEEESENLSV